MDVLLLENPSISRFFIWHSEPLFVAFPIFFSMAKVSLVLFSSLALELFAWRFVSDVLIIVDPIKQAAVHCISSATIDDFYMKYPTI